MLNFGRILKLTHFVNIMRSRQARTALVQALEWH